MIIHIDLYYFTRFFFLFQGSEVAHETHFAASEESGVIQNLIPGETYVFQIEAMTKIGSGPIRHLEKTMPIGGMIFSLFLFCLLFFMSFECLESMLFGRTVNARRYFLFCAVHNRCIFLETA